MNSLLPPPIVYVADASEDIPDHILQEHISSESRRYALSLLEKEKKQFLWSRLILKSVVPQLQPPPTKTLILNEDFSNSLRLTGGFYKYCSIDGSGKFLAVALSVLPINISITKLNENRLLHDLEEIRFPPLFLNWIERQPNPQLAFYQLWTAQICLYRRNDPTIRLIINDEDALTVVGSTASLHETLTFWQSADWLIAVQGPALNSLMTEIRTKEKTIGLLEGNYVEPNVD